MNNRKEILKLILKLNLILGIYNLYLYSQEFLLFNLIVGSLNIGVWVFFCGFGVFNIYNGSPSKL